MTKVSKRRNEHGSVMAISAALALVLVLLVVGFFFFTMYMGGQKETKNAVDAGTLNVARKALDEVSVPVLPTDPFFDVTNDKTNNTLTGCDAKMNLRRINRMWAEAMLFKINALGAEGDQTAQNGTANASNALSKCTTISNLLAARLKQQTNLHPFFTEFAKKNSVRMLGQSATVQEIPGGGWQTSQMEKERESNVTLGGNGGNFFFPPGFNGFKQTDLTKTTRNPAPKGSNGLTFFKGYQPITLGNDDYWQVPFLFDEKPHMVARSNFNPGKNEPGGWANPVPNAFSAEGLASEPGRPAEKATSWALANPRQTFKACIPHSYVHIRIEKPKASYTFLPHLGGPPVTIHSDKEYGFIPDAPSLHGIFPIAGVLCADSTTGTFLTGLDVVGRSLDELIFPPEIPSFNGTNLENNLTSRCNEMISQPGVTISVNEMHSALGNHANRFLLAGNVQDFYMYSPNGKDIHCNALPIATAEAPWVGAAVALNTKPDGKKKSYGESDTFGVPFLPTATPDPFCNIKLLLGLSFWHLENSWTSGTGTNHCLGKVECQRSTTAHTITIATPIF